MLRRVVAALDSHPRIGEIIVSIEDEALLPQALGDLAHRVRFTPSQASAAQSAAAAVREAGGFYPILLTTADHALLDEQMLDHFIAASTPGSDLTVGLARAETILAAHPDARRTFLTFGADRVSGCNLYGLLSDKALRAIDLWQTVEANRKNPLAIVRAFGLHALIRYATRTINLDGAFELAGRRLGLTARPVLMPFANAAVDVDKPDDKELVEEILGR